MTKRQRRKDTKTNTKTKRQRYALLDSLILNVIKGDKKTNTCISFLTDLNVATLLGILFIHFEEKNADSFNAIE